MILQDEICPWENCQAKIRVSYGTRPCPVCGQSIRVAPDWDAVSLLRLIMQALWRGR